MVCIANHERGETDVVSSEDQDLARENERLRRENRILKDLSRTGKQSGRLFSRRMSELPKKSVTGRSPPVRGRNSLCYLRQWRAVADRLLEGLTPLKNVAHGLMRT